MSLGAFASPGKRLRDGVCSERTRHARIWIHTTPNAYAGNCHAHSTAGYCHAAAVANNTSGSYTTAVANCFPGNCHAAADTNRNSTYCDALSQPHPLSPTPVPPTATPTPTPPQYHLLRRLSQPHANTAQPNAGSAYGHANAHTNRNTTYCDALSQPYANGHPYAGSAYGNPVANAHTNRNSTYCDALSQSHANSHPYAGARTGAETPDCARMLQRHLVVG